MRLYHLRLNIMLIKLSMMLIITLSIYMMVIDHLISFIRDLLMKMVKLYKRPRDSMIHHPHLRR